ncbi:unnamed protein product [Brassica napus]|nr:unnamed protein product [Brassica napus]
MILGTKVVPFLKHKMNLLVCEAVIRREIMNKVLTTSVTALVELNMLKNFTGTLLLQAL